MMIRHSCHQSLLPINLSPTTAWTTDLEHPAPHGISHWEKTLVSGVSGGTVIINSCHHCHQSSLPINHPAHHCMVN
jgi:hypothetical protein